MAKSNVYTRTGDTGTTTLVGGERVKKNCIRIEAYGTIDEFSAQLGLAEALIEDSVISQHLRIVQNKLFNIGGYLATDVAPDTQPPAWGLSAEDIANVESWIDCLDEQTPKIKAFVLPGGAHNAAAAHVARTVCRRAERRILDLSETSYVDPLLIKYINRLSDYLFILSRYLNFKQGISEIVWDKNL